MNPTQVRFRLLTVTDPETGRTFFLPAGGSGEPPPPEDSEGEGQGETEGEGEDEEEDSEPKVAKLSRENKKWRHRVKKLESQLAKLTSADEPAGAESDDGDGAGEDTDQGGSDGPEPPGGARTDPGTAVELAIRRHLAERRKSGSPDVVDESEFITLLSPHVATDDSGQPTRVAETVEHFVSRFPGLVAGGRKVDSPPRGRSGDPTAGRRKPSGGGLDYAKMREMNPRVAAILDRRRPGWSGK